MKAPGCAAFLVAMLVVGHAAGLALQSQEKPAPGQDVVKISAELVQVDVIVTDRENKPVKGLKREDFELYDNGKLQNITHFFYEELKARRIEEDPDYPASLPRAITARELKRVVAFVVDTLHMRYENVYRTRKMLEDFIENKMQPGDLVLILPTAGGSGLYQQFTSDQRLLRRAVARLRPFVTTTNGVAGRTIPTTLGRVGGAAPPWTNPINTIEEFDVRATLATLNNMIKGMSKLPGRKISVFVSEGFRVLKTQTSQLLNDTVARAARANVVFYSIDPRGLETLGLEASDDLGVQDQGAFLDERRQSNFETQSSLNALAKDTGGEFFRNNNDLRRGLEGVLEENASYYMLGFQPQEGKWDGRFHTLKVSVRGRKDLRVSTRKGYLARSEQALDPKVEDPKVAVMVEALTSPLVRRDIDLKLTPFYRDDQEGKPVMLTLLHMDTERLSFKQVEGRYKSKVELVGFVFDSSGKAIDEYSTTVDLNLTPPSYNELIKRGLLSTRTVAVKPGVYQLRVFVRETDTGLIGTATNLVEIPNMKSDRLAVSSIFTHGEVLQPDRTVATAGEGSTLSQRRFRRDSQFAYSYVIYNAESAGKSGQTQLETRVRILKGLKVMFDGKRKPVQVLEGSEIPSRIITGGVIQLGDLPPDDYTLEITVIDNLRKKESSRIVRQEVDFSVE